MKNALLLLLLTALLAAVVWWWLGDGGGGTYPDLVRDPLDGLGSEVDAEALASGGRDPGASGPGRTGPSVETDQDPGAGRRAALEVLGRVVDARRRGVERAAVELRLPGWRPIEAVTDADGGYTLRVGRASSSLPGQATVVARASDGRAGTASLWIPPGGAPTLTVETIVLEPAADLRVRVARDEAGVAGATVLAVHRVGTTLTVLATARTDDGGRAVLAGLPTGALEVFASAPGVGRGHARTALPQEEGNVARVTLEGERAVVVEVVDRVTARPVRGAEVLVGDALGMPPPQGPGYLPPLGLPRTDASGRVTVRVGAQDAIYVGARAADYALAPWWGHASRSVKPDQREVRIELERERSVRFAVVAGDTEPPADGSPLRVELPSTAAVLGASAVVAQLDDGVLVVRGLPPSRVNGVVVARDGAQAEFVAEAGAEEGPAVSFRLPRDVTVRVVERDGTAAAGLMLRLGARTTAAVIRPQATDAEGRATFRGVGSDSVTVYTVPPERPLSGPALATLDLTQELDEYEIVLAARLAVRVLVEVDGEARLPPRYKLLAAGAPVSVADIEELPAEGALRVTLRPPEGAGDVVLGLDADGYLPASATIPAPWRSGEETVTVTLTTAGALLVRVVPPPDESYALALQAQDPEGEGWGTARSGGRTQSESGSADASGSVMAHRFEGLAAGRYRVLDARSQAASDPVDVQLGGAPAQVTLDLSAAASIPGRVVAPPGTDFSQVRVRIVGRDDPAQPWSGILPGPDGTFALRAVRGKQLTVTVSHPTLRAAGAVTVGPGRTRIDLRLEGGPEARFRVPGLPAGRPMGGVGAAPVSVHLYRGDPQGEAALVVHPAAVGDGFAFGGYEAGTWTVVFSFRMTFAPLVLRDVDLGAGVTDLGTLSPSEGATVRVRLRVPDGRAPPAVWATVRSAGPPPYQRTATRVDGGLDLVCTGLGAGRVALTVHAHEAGRVTGPQVLLEKTLTLDGHGETVVDLDVP